MLSAQERAAIKRTLTALRFNHGNPSQRAVEIDAQLPTGKYGRVENGYDQLTYEERRRVAKVLDVSVEDVPGQPKPSELEAAS